MQRCVIPQIMAGVCTAHKLDGTATVKHCNRQYRSNTCRVCTCTNSTAQLQSSTVTGNNAVNSGGGLLVHTSSTAELTNAMLRNNTANYGGFVLAHKLNGTATVKHCKRQCRRRECGGLFAHKLDGAVTVKHCNRQYRSRRRWGSLAHKLDGRSGKCNVIKQYRKLRWGFVLAQARRSYSQAL